MSATWKDRLLLGAGAGACAVCCAGPVLAFLGIAGAAGTVGTFVFAGAAFAVVVGVAVLIAMVQRRRVEHRAVCDPRTGPVDVVLGAPPVDEARR